MILTKEEMKAALASVSACIQDRNIVYAKAIELAVLAKLREQEPVAWTQADPDGHIHLAEITKTRECQSLDTWDAQMGWTAVPLYLHPAPIPEGWQLVPIELPEKMLCTMGDDFDGDSFDHVRRLWKLLLAAARSGE